MMESLSLEEENIFKDTKISFQTKKTITIKDKILKDIKNLFGHEEEENYLKPVRVSNFWNKNHIEYKIKGNRNQKLSVEEYLNKIRLYLTLFRMGLFGAAHIWRKVAWWKGYYL